MEARTNRKLKQTKRSQGVSLGACVGVFGEITISSKRQETNATHDPGCWLLLGNQTIERTVTTRKNTFREIQLQAFCLRFGESFFYTGIFFCQFPGLDCALCSKSSTLVTLGHRLNDTISPSLRLWHERYGEQEIEYVEFSK